MLLTQDSAIHLRAQVAQLQTEETHRNVCATVLQSWWRGVAFRKIYFPGMMARRIQATWRRHHSRRQRATVKLQAFWKGYRMRQYKVRAIIATHTARGAVRQAYKFEHKAMLKAGARLRERRIRCLQAE